uniref:Uncharacterized protein n=1 Tax=Oryza meridionalis TaxID=40149 RepID=A0A0E0ECD8_9ORYZ
MILPSFSAIDRPHAPAPHTAAAAADDDDRRAPPPGDPRRIGELIQKEKGDNEGIANRAV